MIPGKMKENTSLHILPNNQPVVQLNCESAFNSLSSNEKKYAHYLSRASWYGGLIAFLQTSPESPVIFALLHKVFLAEPVIELKNKAMAAGVTEDDFAAFLVYSSGILSNAGNYNVFGHNKIIPKLHQDKFEIIIKESKALKKYSNLESLLENVKDALYSLNQKVKNLGLGEEGITTYFSANCTKDDAKLISEFMVRKKLLSHNTRCFKTNVEGDDHRHRYEIRLASMKIGDDPEFTSVEEVFKNAIFKITRGDYNLLLSYVIENLEEAKLYAPNELELNMIRKYVEYFATGSIRQHISSLKLWVKNKSPVVENYIGFITTYKDPVGQRAEFMGIVAMVNPETSKKFLDLVNHAKSILPKLPWGVDFEKDQFLSPDFSSIDVLTYSGSQAVPLGISGPNYDEINQTEGEKNFNFQNARPKINVLPFLSNEDHALCKEHYHQSLEIQVGLHELLGHGSGKLFKELDDGSLNFDKGKIKNPFTGEPVSKHYLKGENYKYVFGPLGYPYEECRAEGVGLYLSLNEEVLKIFGHEGAKADDIIYINWLSLLQKGCSALEYYEPSSKKWLQPHVQARYVLLRVCIEAGEDFVTVFETESGKNLRLTVDRSKIKTTGKKAIGDFLKKLQYYKSIADVEAAQKIFDKYSEVPESGPYPWAKWRDIVLAYRQPRRIFVQANTIIDETGNVILKNYEATNEGLIQSWVERFPDEDVSNKLIELWEKDRKYF